MSKLSSFRMESMSRLTDLGRVVVTLVPGTVYHSRTASTANFHVGSLRKLYSRCWDHHHHRLQGLNWLHRLDNLHLSTWLFIESDARPHADGMAREAPRLHTDIKLRHPSGRAAPFVGQGHSQGVLSARVSDIQVSLVMANVLDPWSLPAARSSSAAVDIQQPSPNQCTRGVQTA